MIARLPLIAAALLASQTVIAQTDEAPDKGWDDAEQAAWAEACTDWDEWDKPAPPFRIYGTSYHVGTCGISAILITGEDGHVLIDSGTRAGADVVAANVEALGFALSDIKLILISHEHYDHVGGVAELKRRTGARLLVSEAAKPVMESGVASPDDPQAGMNEPFEAVEVDGLVEHGEPVTLGTVTLLPVATPGHTLGATSWQWRSCSGQICATMVYADSLTPISNDSYRFSDHPQFLASYREALDRVANLGCTILLSPHPSASAMPRRMSFGSPFGEPSCRAYARGLGERLDAKLAAEQGE